MNKKKLAMGLALALLMLPATAFATTVEAVADKTSVQAGDTVEVVITVQGEDMSIAEGSFTYDPAVLTFTEGEGGASDGFLNLVSVEQGGTDTLKARIVFTAAGEGTANVEAKIEKVLDYDGEEQEGAQASVSIGVSAPAPTPTPEPLDYAKEGVPAQNVQGASEAMYIWKNLENVTIPSRYSETTLEYHEETVAAVQVPDSDAPTLLYLSNQTGDQGGYYIYNAAQDLLYPYMTISSVSKSYIILEPDGSVPLPEGFEETTITIDEREYKAWKATRSRVSICCMPGTPDGEVGYYVYNPLDESLQRYAVMPARPVQPTLAPVATPAPAVPEVTPAPQEPQGVTLETWQFLRPLRGRRLPAAIGDHPHHFPQRGECPPQASGCPAPGGAGTGQAGTGPVGNFALGRKKRLYAASACRKTLGGSGAAAPGGYNRIWRRVRQIRKKPCVARVSLHSSLAAP